MSCAAGLAVLDALKADNLQANAKVVGEQLGKGFKELKRRHEAIGDIRGLGLFWGVEMVADRGQRSPAPDLARTVTRELYKRHILIGSAGPRGNVLKVRPPMSFDLAAADRLLSALDEVLSELT